MIPDAHCHLDQIPDVERALEEALGAGVGPIVAVAMDADSAEATLRLRDRYREHLLAGVGLHPSRVVELSEDETVGHLDRLEQLVPQADLVGEIGLDFKDARDARARARQQVAFDRQLAWASDRRLPVNLHSRRADREVLEAAAGFHERTGLGCLLHWFTHSAKLARACGQKGLFISPGPSILIDPRTAEVCEAIDPAGLLVETDSPVAYGSEGAARPAWARRVFERLAKVRGEHEDDLARDLERNWRAYLGNR